MIRVSWSELKDIATRKQLAFQYADIPSSYTVLLVDSGITFFTNINKTTPANADQIDFENNYRSGSNFRLKDSVLLQGADSSGQASNYIGATGTGEVKASDILSNAVTQGTVSVSVAGAAVEIKAGTTPLANRKSVLIQAQGSGVVYGFSAGSQPFQIAQGTQITLAVGPNIPVFVDRLSGGGSVVVAFAEFS